MSSHSITPSFSRCLRSTSSDFDRFVTLDHALFESQQEDCFAWPHLIAFAGPVCRHAICTEARRITHAFDDPRHKRRAVQLAHLFRNADICVPQRLVINDHIFVLLRRTLLQRIGTSTKQCSPERSVYELKQVEDTSRTDRRAWRLAVEQQV